MISSKHGSISTVLFLTIILFLTGISNLLCGWYWQNPYPQGNTLNSVYFPDISNGYVVGNNGSVIKTTDGGVSWVPSYTSTNKSLNGLYFINSVNGWVVGSEGAVLKTTDGGISWLTINMTTTKNLKTVFFTNSETGYVAGNTGTLLKTTDAGFTWNIMPSGTLADINSLFFINEMTGWAVGSGGAIIKTTNAGISWNTESSGTVSNLNSIRFVSPATGWIAGDGGKILTTINGGDNWTTQISGTGSNLYGVSFANTNIGVLAGANGTILRTINGGANWQNITTPSTQSLNSIQFINGSISFAVGNQGTILMSNDGGLNWLNQTVAANTWLQKITFVDDQHGWAAGFDGNVLRTINAGITWETVYTGYSVSLYSVSFVNQMTGWTSGNSGKILKSTDGGISWQIQVSGVGTRLTCIKFVNENTGWAVGENGVIIKTLDGGTTWNPQTSGTNLELKSVYFINENKGWIAGNNGIILKTDNGGLNWNISNSGTNIGLNTLRFFDANTGWAAGYNGTILKSTDGGISWQSVYNNMTIIINSLSFVSLNDGWAAGSNGTILNTTDGGNTWTNQFTGTTNTFKSIFFNDLDHGWVAGDYGTILKYQRTPSATTLDPLYVANTAATLHGEAHSNGAFTHVEFEWGVTQDYGNIATANPSSFENEGSFPKNILAYLTGLQPGQTYHYRLKAYNIGGVSYGSDITFTAHQGTYIPVPANWNLTITDNQSTIVVPANINPMIGNIRPIQNSDIIGLFYSRDGVLTCAGYSIWNGSNLGISVWGDDASTTVKDGYASGESYIFKIWDAQAGAEYFATATFSDGPDYYQANTISVLSSLTALTDAISAQANLPEGWSMISSYVDPIHPNIAMTFGSIVNQLEIAKNGLGQMYVPQYSINTIGNWNILDGYQVKLSSPGVLNIIGMKVIPENTPIALSADQNGWNLKAYLRNSSMPITTALSNYINQIILVKDGSGHMFYPQWDINTIGDMMPMSGYMFKVSSSFNLYYPPDNTPKSILSDQLITPSASHLRPIYTNTGNDATLLLKLPGIPDGCEVGIYKADGTIVGSGYVQKEAAGITIWGDDISTEQVEGAQDGELLSVSLFSSQNYSLDNLAISVNGPDQATGGYIKYKPNDVYFGTARIDNTIPDIFSVSVSPNPATNFIYLSYSLPESSQVKIEITNEIGEISLQINDGTIYNMEKQTREIDVSRLQPGVYNITLTAGNLVKLARLVVVR